MTDRKISMPEPVHECTQRVLYGDTDAGGVVYNANYLRYFEKGRSGFMRDLVFSYRDISCRWWKVISVTRRRPVMRIFS